MKDFIIKVFKDGELIIGEDIINFSDRDLFEATQQEMFWWIEEAARKGIPLCITRAQIICDLSYPIQTL